MENNTQNADPPVEVANDECGCGNDAKANALREVAEAKDRIARGEAEIEHGVADVKQGEENLAKAEHDLEAVRRHKITFFLDGEKEITEEHKLTPNEIIREFGKRDPAKTYLVKIEGHHQESYRDKGEIPIEIHDCDHFQMVNIGPTPVSDSAPLGGVAVFISGLKALGYSPVALKDASNSVVIDYIVPTGKFAGKNVRLGFDVPTDFPMAPPGGIHVSPRIHPNRSGKNHPFEGISDSANFQAKASGEWQYWSRPYPDWVSVKKTVGTYMSYIGHLWATQ